MGDINIDSYNCNHSGHDKLKHFCDIYDLSNLIKGNTCFMNKHKSSIDIILTNKPKSFQHTVTFETGLSDYHHMISTSLKTHLIRLKPKVITYRCYKKLNQNDFLADIENAEFNCNLENADDSYNNLTNTFSKIVDKHVPIKRKILRGNDAPFMNKELRKAIYCRSHLKNKLNKHQSDENRRKFKQQRNKCVSLRKKKNHISTILRKMVLWATKLFGT